MRQLTSSNRAVKNQVMVGAGFLNYLAGESERIGRCQKRTLATHAKPDSSPDIFESADFAVDVVRGMRRLHMLVVETALEHHVAVSDHVPGVGVVVHGIRIQNVSPIVYFCVSAQLINRAIFLLAFGGADRNVFS